MARFEISEKQGRASISITGWALVVIVLILIVAVAIPSTGPVQLTLAKRAKAGNTVSQIQAGYLAYYTEYDEWPRATDNVQLMKILEGENERKIEFLALKKSDLDSQGRVIDPWGTPYKITIGTDFKLHVISAGPDKVFGTPDDIGN